MRLVGELNLVLKADLRCITHKKKKKIMRFSFHQLAPSGVDQTYMYRSDRILVENKKEKKQAAFCLRSFVSLYELYEADCTFFIFCVNMKKNNFLIFCTRQCFLQFEKQLRLQKALKTS